MEKKNVLFDLDGVLLDSESDLEWLNRALKDALEDLGVPTTEANLKKLYPGGLDEFEESVNDFPGTPDEIWRVRDKYYVAKKVSMIEKGKLEPFSDVSYIEKLKPEYSLGVISNSPKEVVDLFLKNYDLSGIFEDWVGRGSRLEDLKRIKPDPYLFGEIKRNMGEGQYWYVGDRESDAEFAENAGIDFLRLTRNENGFHGLKEVVDYLL
jgi:phosphoglycolate phosphatase